MLGAEDQRPTSPDGTHMAPIMKFGLATNSIGYLVTDDNAMVWRGPMASKALMQMLQETLWPDLDYLVLDMPPGTGDIQLTLAQNIPVTGAVVVTTPQDIALIDAKKGIVMFESGSAGAGYRGKHEHAYLQQLRTPRADLRHRRRAKTGGEIPHPAAGPAAAAYHAAEDLDNGTPTVVARPESEFTETYRQLADRVAAQLYWQGK
jgi:ATP-binding protein involved in chromosome partitioning